MGDILPPLSPLAAALEWPEPGMVAMIAGYDG